MAKKLTQKKLNSMFKAYCEKQSVRYVSRKCRCSHVTARKYRDLQGWDNRVAQIQHKAQEKQDESLADSLAQNLKVVQFAKDKILELIQAGGQVSKSPAADLDKMIRLELLLRGEADSRIETKETGLKDVSTEKLLKMQKRLRKSSGKH